jgi:O-antigen ligase
MFSNLTSLFFVLSIFGSPIFLGSMAIIVPLVCGLIWLAIYWGTVQLRQIELPFFLKVWQFTAFGFFLHFATIDFDWNSIQFGFNTFSFLLTVGVFVHFVKNKNREFLFTAATYVACVGLFFGVAWAIYEHDYIGKFRVSSIVGGGPNLIARVAIMLAMFSSLMLHFKGRRNIRLCLFVCSVCMAILVTLYAGSRGAILGFPILLLFPTLFALPLKWLTSSIAWIITCSLVGFTLLCVVILDPTGFVNSLIMGVMSFFSGDSMDASTLIRYQMWQVAFKSFIEHPIIGTGWHSFVAVTQNTILAEYAAGNKYFNFHADIANFAVAGGIVGLILYFLLLFAPLLFWDTPKDHPYFRVRLYWAVTMPILYLVLGLTDMVMGFDYPTMFYAFSFAIIWGLTEQKKRSNTKVRHR